MQDRYKNCGCMVDNIHLGGGIDASLKFKGIIVVCICQRETLRWLETCHASGRTMSYNTHPCCPSDQSSFISHRPY
jgi:hypothetical protein